MKEFLEYDSRMSWLNEILKKNLFLSLDAEIVLSNIEQLNEFDIHLREIRDFFIKEGNEEFSKKCLEVIVFSKSLKKSLDCLTLIKNLNFHDAWDSLVDAQQICTKGLFAGILLSELKELQSRLLDWERLFFPPQVFTSIGMIVKKAKCSICSQDPMKCPHQRGKVYMGRICKFTVEDSEWFEQSIVEIPDDKKCRIIYYNDQGRDIDKLTYKTIATGKNEHGTFECKAVSTHSLEL